MNENIQATQSFPFNVHTDLDKRIRCIYEEQCIACRLLGKRFALTSQVAFSLSDLHQRTLTATDRPSLLE